MGPDRPLAKVVRFGVFDLDPEAHELRKNGSRVKLQEQPFQILATLVERGGEVVTREELRQQLWPSDTFVDFDHSLNTAVKKLREALDNSADNPRFVETVPRRGYRFIAPVKAQAPGLPQVESPQNGTALGAERKGLARNSRVRWVALLTLAVVVLAAYLLRRHWAPGAEATHGRVMLAVLPFENLSGDPSQDYFSDGLTEETITDLGELDSTRLGVIARTSAMTYKGTNKSVAQIGEELGVDYVLEGGVRKDSDHVRISAQLIRVKDQTHLWAHSYETELKEFLTVQGAMGQAIADAVQLKVTPQTSHPAPHTLNPQAYDAYLRGRFFMYQVTPPMLLTAIGHYQQAAQLDPYDADAYVGLAISYGLLPITSDVPNHEAFANAEAAARKALELDPNLAGAHCALGVALLAGLGLGRHRPGISKGHGVECQ